MTYTDKINAAILCAVNAHAGQLRKGTSVPYITHPIEAMGVVASLTDDENVIAAAVLHDVVEDAGITVEELRGRFGDRVAQLVSAESEDKMTSVPAAESWMTRKQATIDELSACKDIGIKMIALGDKLSNLRSIERDHAALGEKVWDRFNQKDPLMHKWYYVSFLDTLAELKETDAYKEYAQLIERCWG